MIAKADNVKRVPGESATELDNLAALITRVAQGDDSALETLYDGTVGKVYALALAISKSREDADEITCDVYTQVWIKAADFDASRGNSMAWLLMMCRSRALDLIRRNQKHIIDVVDNDASIDCAGADPDTPELQMGRLQDSADVTRALQSLSEVQRQAVVMAFFRGASHGEVAAALGVPLGTAKSHIRRALQSLHESLDLSV